MKAYLLTTDEEIKKAYEDPAMTIYFREGGEGNYDNIKHHDLETIIDATSHGFEFVAVEGFEEDVLEEEYVDLENYDIER